MKDAPSGQEFFFHDGSAAKNISEMLEQIKKMPPQEFSSHCNKEKNDFYEWVKSCIDPKIASTIKLVKNQRQMVEKLTGHHWQQEHKAMHNY